MNAHRYLRLMVLASIEMACTIPIGIYSIYIANVGVPIQPWISWENIHFGFSFVGQVSAVEWRSNHSFLTAVELTRWLFLVCALLFFTLFGFANEAKKNHALFFRWIAKRFGVSRLSPSGPKSSTSRVIFSVRYLTCAKSQSRY